MKLSQVTKAKCRMVPTSLDAELVIKHENGTLPYMMATHVDDLKLTGERKVIEWVLRCIQE
eukprot:13876950-Heterocapsa_arctica.AAC.1